MFHTESAGCVPPAICIQLARAAGVCLHACEDVCLHCSCYTYRYVQSSNHCVTCGVPVAIGRVKVIGRCQ
jgi:hypothetical protein